MERLQTPRREQKSILDFCSPLSAESKWTRSRGPTMDIFVHGWPKMVQEAYFLSFGVGCLNSFFGVTFDGVPHRLTLQKQSLLELRSPEIIN